MQAAGGLNLSAIQRLGRSLAAERALYAKHYILRLQPQHYSEAQTGASPGQMFPSPGGNGKPSAIRRRPLERPEFAFPRGFRRSASDGHVARLRCPVSRIFDHDV